MRTFAKFTENNDHEGENWTFWLQVEGNQEQFEKLQAAISRVEEAQDSELEYQITPDVVLNEHDVDVLVEHGGEGYMNNHTKVPGTLVVPDDLVQNSEYGLHVDALYKGGITKLFSGTV